MMELEQLAILPLNWADTHKHRQVPISELDIWKVGGSVEDPCGNTA